MRGLVVHQDARYTRNRECSKGLNNVPAWFGRASRCTLRTENAPHGDQQHEPCIIKKLTSHEEKSAFDITYSVI